MDRSQVRQFGLNRSIYSSKIMGMSTVLHSPRCNTQRELHLRKSRIANIPDTRNINLSQNLQFVIIFQTIQIQRMSQQIQLLRIRSKQYQRQLFNSDNYQIQIKQLTQRCFRFQSQKNTYRQELFQTKRSSQMIFNQFEQIKKNYVNVDFTSNQKYKLQRTRNDQLTAQVQKWKNRYNALDQSKSKQLQLIKRMMQQQSKTHLSRQTKQILDRFELEKQDMQQMVKSLKQVNVQKQTELKKYKFQFQTKDKLVEEMEKQVDQYEEKVALLSQENYRLSQLSKNKQIQIMKLRDRLKDIEQSTAKNNQDVVTKVQQNKKLTRQLQKIQQNINQKQGKLTKLQKMSLNDKERLSQLDRIVFLLKQRQNEIQSKSKTLERKDKKIAVLEEGLKVLQESQIILVRQISGLKKRSTQMAASIVQLITSIQLLIKKQQYQKNISNSELQQMQQHFKMFQQQMTKKSTQIITFSQSLISQIHENQQYIRQMQQTLNKSVKQKQQLQQHKIELITQNQQFTIKQQQLLRENQSLSKYINRLQQQNSQLLKQKQYIIKNIEIKQTNIMLESKKQIQQVEQSKIKQVQKRIKQVQIQYQTNVVNRFKSEIDMKQKEFQHIKRQLQKQINTYQSLSKQNQAQIIKLKDQIANKNIQLTKRQKILLTLQQQSLQKQIIINQLTATISTLSSNYTQHVKAQIQTVWKRIQHVQRIISKITQYFNEKIIKDQQLYIQKQKQYDIKINDLIDLNTNLIQKNNSAYDMLLEVVDTRTLTTAIDAKRNNSVSLKNIAQTQQYPISPSTTNTIYTTASTQSFRNINSPRANNQNYNSQNINNKIGSKIKQTIKGNFNNQFSSTIPLQFLIKHVIVCTQLQSLRQRLGDKNAKVEKMKNSLMVSNVSSNKSFVAIVNGRNVKEDNHNGQMFDSSNLMSNTLINKLNPFTMSVAGTFNQETSFIHQSRFVQTGQRFISGGGGNGQRNIQKVTSEEHYAVDNSPESSLILDISSNRNTGIYTKRVSGSGVGGGLFGRNGFKSINIKKSSAFN